MNELLCFKAPIKAVLPYPQLHPRFREKLAGQQGGNRMGRSMHLAGL